MAPVLTSPTDPLEVLCDQAVAAIRRHVTVVRARIAEWEPADLDDAPAHGHPRRWSVR